MAELKANWPNNSLYFRWIPAHVGVPRNEVVDYRTTARSKEEWSLDWQGSKHGVVLRKLLPHLDKSLLQIYSGMMCAESTVMI